jgi:hypothetical protein
MKLRCLAAALPAILILGGAARAQTLTITSSKDNTLFENAVGARSGGASPYLHAPGDATWIHTSLNTSFWATPGGA